MSITLRAGESINLTTYEIASQPQTVGLEDIAYALQGEYLARITDQWQRNRVAQGVRRNDLAALKFAFPAS